MALIRNGRASGLVQNAVVLDLGDLRSQAERLKKHAQEEADRIVREAKETAARLTGGAAEKGHQEGFTRGLEEGRSKGQQEGTTQALTEMKATIEQLENAWGEAIESFSQQREQMLIEARCDVLRLALDIARRVVHRQIEVDETVIEDQIATTLKMLSGRTAAVVSIHPEDRPHAEQVLPTLIESIRDCDDVRLVDDSSVARGGCLVGCGATEIDSTIETQIGRIVETLLPGSVSGSEGDVILDDDGGDS